MRVPELMDDPALSRELHLEALRGLDRLNRVSRTADTIWKELRTIAREKKLRGKFRPAENQSLSVRVLDIATGSGDTLISLARLAKRDGFEFEFVGADISPTAINHANANAQRKAASVSFVRIDALNDSLPDHFDVVMTSLFTHHLDPEQVISLFKEMKESGAQMILVNDLLRSQLSYWLVWLATRLFSCSAVVRFDGPVSVQAAYTIDEMREMAKKSRFGWLYHQESSALPAAIGLEA
jgi:Methylase involved in ubiquinone/menaquinone biosynthesis